MSGRMPKLNRNISFQVNSNGNNSLNPGDSIDTSPLKLFTRAKNAINSIYMDFYTFIEEAYTFIDGKSYIFCLFYFALLVFDVFSVPDLTKFEIIDENEVDNLRRFQERCDGIMKMIARDRMKVVFFGRTSNGKSTLINAMLREKILPTGIGHTTNCFLQVEGSEGAGEPCIFIPDNEVALDVSNLSHLGSALSSTKLNCDSVVRVLWPKEKCRLLKEDVVFVDSPGIDVKSDLDAWIDQQCLDADVFVLVVNAESVLTRTEREFFNKVNNRLSKPNIFILNNRWDATAYEPESAEEVKKQHIQIDTEFLCDELKVCDQQEATNRIYFISAREALFSRTQTNPHLPPGHQSRMLQLEWFEAEFEKCISMSAVKTKFDQPTQTGKAMASQLKSTLETIYNKANELKNSSETKYNQVNNKINNIETKIQTFTQDMKHKIRNVMDDVEKKVSITLNDEIKRLYSIIDEYERPFHPDEYQINWYKKELHTFVEQKLGSNLSTRLNVALIQSLENTQKEIRNCVLECVESEENRKRVLKEIPRSDFSINYRLDCSNLCADFKEDIRFKFSLGFTALMNRFTGKPMHSYSTAFLTAQSQNSSSFFANHSNTIDGKIDPIYENQQRQLSSNLNPFVSNTSQAANALLMLQSFQIIASKSNFMLLAVGGVVWKGLGWRILAITGSMYGLIYLYERLMWTKKTQERLFKKQYADYASSKLKLIVDLTSQNAASQVQQELSMYFAQMCRYIDITRDELYKDMKTSENDIQIANKILNQAKILKYNFEMILNNS